MHHFFASIFGLFLSPAGILVLAALDSTMLFFLPAAIDTAVIIMTAKNPDLFWLYPALAAAGSVAGAAITFEFGHRAGEAGLKRWIPERQLVKVRHKLDHGGVVAMGMTAVLPPPFPLTPFVLTSGAFGLDRRKFFLTLGTMRFVRFGIESLLALVYGRRIAGWLLSDTFAYVIAVFVLAAMAGTALTIIRLLRKGR